MKHPEIGLLPILMFSDYFLTVLGAIQKDKKYSDHFKGQQYELNPVWQHQVMQRKWLNSRHILLTVLVSGTLALLLEFGRFPDYVAEGLFGCLFVCFGMIIGRHLANLMVFRYFNRRPDEISGQIIMAPSLLLSISTYQYLVAAIPLVFVAVFAPTPFALGGLIGAGLLFVAHFRWIRLHMKQTKRLAHRMPAMLNRTPDP